MATSRTEVIEGVGPGLGESLAQKFADEERAVGLFARPRSYIADVIDDVPTDAVVRGR